MLALVRILIGLVFLIAGLEKLLSPYQNFLYVIQAYQVLPAAGENLTARVFPWVELFAGLFTVLGLWTPWSLKANLVLNSIFITVVGQALLRGLDIDQCGCFGSLAHISLQQVLVLDSVLLLSIVYLLCHLSKANQFSLDRLFEK